jgi:hypothetical protein
MNLQQGLNACLQQVERLIASSGRDLATRQDLERLQRLVNEFRPELTATLGSRVNALEGRTARLEERQFSTTTKLFGQAVFGIQGRSENSFDFFLNRFCKTRAQISTLLTMYSSVCLPVQPSQSIAYWTRRR